MNVHKQSTVSAYMGTVWRQLVACECNTTLSSSQADQHLLSAFGRALGLNVSTAAAAASTAADASLASFCFRFRYYYCFLSSLFLRSSPCFLMFHCTDTAIRDCLLSFA